MIDYMKLDTYKFTGCDNLNKYIRTLCSTSLLTILLSTTTVSYAISNQTIEQNKNKINQLRKESDDLNSEKSSLDSELTKLIEQLNTKQKEINSVEDKVERLQSEINVLKKDIDNLNSDIKKAEKKIRKNEKNYKEQEKKQELQQDVLKNRVKRYYMNHSYNEFLGILLDSDSLSEIAFKFKYINDIMLNDRAIISELERTKIELSEIKDSLEEEKANLNRQIDKMNMIKKELEDKQATLIEEKDKLESEYSNIEKIENKKRKRLDKLTQAQKDFQTQIYELETENQRITQALQAPSSEDMSNVSINTSSKGFLKPTTGRYTSMFGPRVHPITGVYKLHTGIDIANSYGTPIYAANPGKVIRASYYGAYGNTVIVDHGNGYKTLYAHLQSFNVSVGDMVSRGQKLGGMGSTGYSTGPHLHFEVRVNGTPKNPINYI